MTELHPLELLAPAKNADIGIEAILHGADAVYIGGPNFGAREDAANAFKDIQRLTNFAHRYNARVYMTLNTIVSDEELPLAVQTAWQAYEAGVDALIVQDMGILEMELPPIQLHASTQCDVRSPAKAQFLESIGFSQVVLARELSLKEVKACKDKLSHARIEYFVHGALCVSYSGQCYASFATTGRSANRGACAQLCRLPYSVYTEDGELLANDRHVLSLKDNNQSDNLSALIHAGVSSFKIEGRLKDLDYVKNITAYYRQKLDEFIEKNPQYHRTSDGISHITFNPQPQKSFNRGFTDYFTRERHHDMVVFETPKNTGEPLGTLTKLTADYIDIETYEAINNADGLTYLTREKTLAGFMVNTATELKPGLWRITLRDRPISRKHPQLVPGMTIYRNRDHAWEELMRKPTATRTLPVDIVWTASDKGFTLSMTDPRGNKATSILVPENLQQTTNLEKNRANIEKNLSKLGGSDLEIRTLVIQGENFFAPSSIVNDLRRKVVDELWMIRANAFEKLPKAQVTELLPYPDATDFRSNVLNEKAVIFYAKHNTAITEPALETGDVKREVPVMVTKHCVRYALGRCLKDNLETIKANPELKEIFKPSPLILKTGGQTLKAIFDCKKCEMTLMGRVKTSTSLGHVRLLRKDCQEGSY